MTPRTWTLAIAALLVVAVVAGTAWSLASARNTLADGRAAAERAEEALADQELGDAADALATAHRAFDRGATRLSSPGTWPARVVPGLARNVEAARGLAEASADATGAGADLLDQLAGLSDGLATFAPRDGRLPIEELEPLAQPLAATRDALADAEARATDTPDTWLVGELAAARDQLVHRLGTAHEAVGTAAALAEQLPAFLGGDGPRRYLVGAQNPAELRGTGGLIGAIGELTVEDGAIEVSEFRSVGSLTAAAPDELPPPSEDFAARYARYGAITHGSNINMTPDVPTAARALERLYAAVEDAPVDGTILADPVFFRALVELAGPVEVPGVGQLDAAEVVAFATRDQYELLDDRPDRKELLGDVAEAALRTFLDGTGEPREALDVLGDAATDGRLRIHAVDDAEQAAFAAAGLDGSMADPDGDYLAVIGNNAAAHKGDTFYDRALTYTVRLREDGSATGQLTMELANRAPTEGYHETVLGHRLDAPGDNRTIWSVYCAPGCQITAFRRDGESGPISVQRELGRPVATATTELSSGESTTLEWEWELDRAWKAGRYELTIDGQPHLMDSTTAVRVHPPKDHELRAVAGSPLEAPADGAARFDGPVTDRQQLAVDVGPSATGSLLDWAREAVNRPLVELAR